MNTRLQYSFLAFLVSAMLHAGLWGFIANYELDKSQPKEEITKISMQLAMFKPAVVPPPLEEITHKINTAKPVEKTKPKPKAKIKPKKKPIKPKRVVKKKLVKKKVKKVIRKKLPKENAPPKTLPPKVVTKVHDQQRHQVQRPQTKPTSVKKMTPQRPHKTTNDVSKQPRQPKKVAHNPLLESQYGRRVKQEIQQRKKYPRRAQKMRKQGVVKVGFTLAKSGILSNLRIVESSGVKSLDKAALKAVRKVGRFPAFPVGLNKQSIGYIIPINYQL